MTTIKRKSLKTGEEYALIPVPIANGNIETPEPIPEDIFAIIQRRLAALPLNVYPIPYHLQPIDTVEGLEDRLGNIEAQIDGVSGTLSISSAFAYGDATPAKIGTAKAGCMVVAASIVIDAAFDGDGAWLSIGTLAEPHAFLRPDDNAPSNVARYEANPGVRVASDTDVYLFIAPGMGATHGSGVAYLETKSL